MQRVVLFDPAHRGGGTTNLMTNLGKHWPRDDVNLVVADFPGGFMSTSLGELGIPFEHRIYYRDHHIHVHPDEVLVGTVLSGRGIGQRILMSDDARLVLWLTHPDDGFKWLPLYHPARRW